MLVFLFLASGCSWSKPAVPAVAAPVVSEQQVCPPPPVCAVCEPLVCPPVPAPKVIKTIVKVPAPPTRGGKLNLPIIGETEKVTVSPPGIIYEARIDTGAESSSLHAENIRVMERDGKKYVVFHIYNPATKELMPMEQRLVRTVLIKQKEGPSERRNVIKLWLTLGDIKEQVDVTLTDRADFDYSLLVGRNFLTDTAIVDVSRRHTIAPPKLKAAGARPSNKE